MESMNNSYSGVRTWLVRVACFLGGVWGAAAIAGEETWALSWDISAVPAASMLEFWHSMFAVVEGVAIIGKVEVARLVKVNTPKIIKMSSRQMAARRSRTELIHVEHSRSWGTIRWAHLKSKNLSNILRGETLLELDWKEGKFVLGKQRTTRGVRFQLSALA
jgi:hypothetical protein